MLDQTEARHKRHRSIIRKRVRVWNTLEKPGAEEEDDKFEEEKDEEECLESEREMKEMLPRSTEPPPAGAEGPMGTRT
jgi:hypothetical protein